MKITPQAADAFAAAFAAKPDLMVSGQVHQKPAKQQRFWVVWNPLHPTPPKVKYPSKASAEMGAKKLASRHPDQADNIYVLQLSSAWKRTGAGKPKSRHY